MALLFYVLLIPLVVCDKQRKNTSPEPLQRGIKAVAGQGHKPVWQKGVVVAQVNRPASDYGSARFDSTLENLSRLHVELAYIYAAIGVIPLILTAEFEEPKLPE